MAEYFKFIKSLKNTLRVDTLARLAFHFDFQESIGFLLSSTGAALGNQTCGLLIKPQLQCFRSEQAQKQDKKNKTEFYWIWLIKWS